MPPSLSSTPLPTPTTGTTRRAGWLLPAGLLFLLLLLGRWSQLPATGRSSSPTRGSVLGSLPQRVLVPAPTSAL